MVNIIGLIKSIGFFLGAFFLIVLTNWIIPIVQTAGDTFYTNNEISSIIWFGAIIIWILAGVVAPIFLCYNALNEPDNMGELQKAAIGVLLFIFGIIFTIKAWYMVDALRQLAINLDGTANGFIAIIFWIGLLSVWTMIVILAPYKLIMQSLNKETII